MKTKLKLLAAYTAGWLLLGGSTLANNVTAYAQMGFTLQLSSGTLNVTPAGTLNTAGAHAHDPSIPLTMNASSATTDGYAFADAGLSQGISTALYAPGDFFLWDAYASTDAGPHANGGADAASLGFYDLSFSGVVGSTVTLTLTPEFYVNSVTTTGTPLVNYGYVSAFLSLGGYSFLSYLTLGDASGYAELGSFSLEFGADEIVQLNGALTAGVSVPDTGGSLGLLAVGLAALVGLRRMRGHALVRS